MMTRRRALVFVILVGCGGGAASASKASSGPTPSAAPTVASASASATDVDGTAPHFTTTDVVVAPTTAHAPAFTLPKALPPVGPLAKNPGSNPPTATQLEAAFAGAKTGTAEHAKAGRRLAETCRGGELAFGDTAAAAVAKLAKAPSDVATKKSFLDARKSYELMRHCVVDAYRKIAEADPTYAQGDEVLHALAAEYEDRRVFVPDEDLALVESDRQQSLAASLELVKRYPKSRFVSAAYRRFADHYFDEALRGKVDWALAEQAYLRVRDGSDPATEIENAYAHYRLGYVAWNQGRLADAKTELRAAIDVTTKYPALPHAPALLAAASDALAHLP